MKLKHPLLIDVAALATTSLVRLWMSRLHYKIFYHDPQVDPALCEQPRQRLYIFWHEYILFPLYLRGHCDIAMLVSRHADANVLTRVALHMGFGVIRGSTRRGGTAALRQLLQTGQRQNLTITPDGPRGPRRRLAPGPVFLASRLQIPIVAMGFGYDRPWRLNSWDRFAIPRPGTRARAVISREIQIPPDLDREGLEVQRTAVERLLNRLTCEAEHWAETGYRRPDEQRLERRVARHPLHRVDHPHPRATAHHRPFPSPAPRSGGAEVL